MCSENLLGGEEEGRTPGREELQGRAVLAVPRQWLFRRSIQLCVRQVGVQKMCLLGGYDVREVVNLPSRG